MGLIGRGLIADWQNLNPAHEGPVGETECRVAFGKSAETDKFSLGDFFADQFEAVTGNDHIGGGKAESEHLRRSGGIIGEVGLPGGQLIMQQLARGVADAQMRGRHELDKNTVIVVHAVFGLREIFLRELVAQSGGG